MTMRIPISLRRLLLCSSVVAVCIPVVSLACTTGTTYTKAVGEFTAQMSYDTYRIRPGQTVHFHFDLNNISHRSYGPGNPIDYDYVEAIFRHGDKVIHTQSVDRINYGETAFDYTMPEAHEDYIVDIRYMRKDKEMASWSLPVRVGRGNIWRTILSLGRANARLLEGVAITRI